MPTPTDTLASNMADLQLQQQLEQRQQQLLAELDRLLSESVKDDEKIVKLIFAIISTKGMGPDWVQQNFYDSNEGGRFEAATKFITELFSPSGGLCKSRKLAIYIKMALDDLRFYTLEKFTEEYQKANTERNISKGPWFYLGLRIEMNDDVNNAIKLIRAENEKEQHQPFPAGPAAASSNNNNRSTDDRTETTFQSQQQQQLPFSVPFSVPNTSLGGEGIHFNSRSSSLFPSTPTRSVHTSFGGEGIHFNSRSSSLFPSTPTRSVHTTLGGKENFLNISRSSSVASSTPTTSVRSFSAVQSSKKAAQKHQIKRMLTGTPSGNGFTGLDELSVNSSIAGDLNSGVDVTKMTSKDISSKFDFNDTLSDWESSFDAIQETLDQVQQPNNGKVLQKITSVRHKISRQSFQSFMDCVITQAALWDNNISALKKEIANLEGCLNKDALREVGDGLASEREDKLEEEIRLIRLRCDNDIAQREAQRDKDIADTRGRYAEEDIKQNHIGKTSTRKFASDLKDANAALTEEQEEKVDTLTPAKAKLYIFERTFELVEFLSVKSTLNPSTQLYDFEKNPDANQEYRQKWEHLSRVHTLFKAENWMELKDIVW